MPTTKQVITQENLVAQFPKEVTKIHGEPTALQVFQLRDDVRANASTIPSHLGGGLLGCLGLVCTILQYARICVTEFERPENPGPRPIYPPNVTVANRRNIKEIFDTDTQEYLTVQAVDIALKMYIIQCVDDRYIRALREANTQYGNRTALDLLTHIITNYGPTGPQELTENVARLNQEWNIATSFEDLIDQIETAVDFADLGDQPFTSAQIINSAFHNVFRTGAYNQTLHEWELKPAEEKTWENFKPYMLIAQRRRSKEQAVTTGRQGYAIQAIEAGLHELQAEMQNQQAEMQLQRAETYATANAASEMAVPFQEALQQVALLKQGSSNGHNAKRHNNNNNKSGSNKRQQTIRNDSSTNRGRNTWDDYCWTHGYIIRPGHNSKTCRSPHPGHKKEANKDDHMGGSTDGILNRKPLGN